MILLAALVVEALICLGGLALGVRSAAHRRHWPAGVLAVCSGLAVAGLLLRFPRYAEHTRLLEGVLSGAILLGVLPQIALHWVGYRLAPSLAQRPAESRRVMIRMWLGATAVLAPYSLYVLYTAATLVQCHSGAGCPVR